MQTCSSDDCPPNYDIKTLDLLNPESQLTNTKLLDRNKLKDLLDELEMFKTRTTLILKYEK